MWKSFGTVACSPMTGSEVTIDGGGGLDKGEFLSITAPSRAGVVVEAEVGDSLEVGCKN